MRTELKGLCGSSPLGFMAAVGLLRVLSRSHQGEVRLGFNDDGTCAAWIECADTLDLVDCVVADAMQSVGSQPWRLEYAKEEKKGTKMVADLKPPPAAFATFLGLAIQEWTLGQSERADYAAAYATDVAVDGKGNTKPSAFHFTAANQQFLGAIEETRRLITRQWVEHSFADKPRKCRPGTNLRWDPDAERNRALMGVNPTKDGTSVNAPLEWLAFRGLPMFPCFPVGTRIVTTGVSGRRQDELCFHWPLWSSGVTVRTLRSLLQLAVLWDGSGRHERSASERLERGVFAMCSSEIRRTAQGFGNFSPASMRP